MNGTCPWVGHRRGPGLSYEGRGRSASGSSSRVSRIASTVPPAINAWKSTSPSAARDSTPAMCTRSRCRSVSKIKSSTSPVQPYAARKVSSRRRRSSKARKPSSAATRLACRGTHAHAVKARSQSRVPGPEKSQSKKPTRPDRSQQALYGAASLWQMSVPASAGASPRHEASAGGRMLRRPRGSHGASVQHRQGPRPSAPRRATACCPQPKLRAGRRALRVRVRLCPAVAGICRSRRRADGPAAPERLASRVLFCAGLCRRREPERVKRPETVGV